MSLEDKNSDAMGRAAEWWLLNRQRNASERAGDHFLAWLRESPLHVHAYLSIAASDKSLAEAAHDWPETTQQLVAGAAAEEEADAVPIRSTGTVEIVRPPDHPTASRWRFVIAAATSLAVATFLLRGWLLRDSELI